MKTAIVLSVFAFIVLSTGKPQSKACAIYMGRCYKECEVGTHAYIVDCGSLTPEPTCDEPNPVTLEDAGCDFAGCYCDAPTVRDRHSRKCVKLEECPKKEE